MLMNESLLQSQSVGLFAALFGAKPKPKPVAQPDRSKLAEIHPALRAANSFALHRFGTDKEFAKWRQELFGDQFASFEVITVSGSPDRDELNPEVLSAFSRAGAFATSRNVGGATVQLIAAQRNAPSLFGVGLLDRVPDSVLEEIASDQARAT